MISVYNRIALICLEYVSLVEQQNLVQKFKVSAEKMLK